MNTEKSLRAFRNNAKGSALVEFAIITPLMMLMLCGAMDFSRIVFAGIAVANAARAGVQYGALTPGHSGDVPGMIQAATDDAAGQGLTGFSATARNFCGCSGSTSEISCSNTCSGATPNGYVEVTASYTFSTLVNMPGIPSSTVLTSTAKMRAQ